MVAGVTRRKRLRVAVAGSRSFPLTPLVGKAVIDMLLGYPKGTVFLTRGSEGFDTWILLVCSELDLPVEVRAAEGGADNFRRDAEMARDCDELLAFLDPATIHREDTGTAHMLEKALDQRRRTRAYSVGAEGLVYVGSSD